MPRIDKLKQYRNKRDFSRTGEPSGKLEDNPLNRARFVVQKHAARRLHYDLRLELGGVLKSWAVPKGPSLDPAVRRLAIETEDHPLEYAEFEGVIPQGEYGAGAMIVWDKGTWSSNDDPVRALEKGKLKFTLVGEKLNGNWSLVRTKHQGEKRSWLLIKHQDEAAERGSKDRLLAEQPASVLTERRVEELNSGSGTASHPRHSGSVEQQITKRAAELEALGGIKAELPEFVSPQLAQRVSKLPSGEKWLHELKIDGYRIQARIETGSVELLTRNRISRKEQYPSIVSALRKLPLSTALLDGEVAVTLPDGRISFEALQNRDSNESKEGLLQYYIFDLLYLNGFDLRDIPLSERKKVLKELLTDKPQESLRFSDDFQGNAQAFFKAVCAAGAEGVVSKERDAAYRSGRSAYWRKLKCTSRQEFVVGGMTRINGAAEMGALLLGVYKRDKLYYVGKVGTGFNDRERKRIFQRLSNQAQEKTPFTNPPRGEKPLWLRPTEVVEVEYANRTANGSIRHPVFKGFRTDKSPIEVTPDFRLEDPERQRVAPSRHKPNPSALEAEVMLSSPDRIVYPDAGITKKDVFEHYRRAAPLMLPEIRMRPLTLLRCPNGISAKCFYQRHISTGIPESIPGLHFLDKGKEVELLTVNSIQHILELVQLSTLEFHAWNVRGNSLDTPDRIVFDLDPDTALPAEEVVTGAGLLREALEYLGLVGFIRLTGGKGVHIVSPLLPRASRQDVRRFAEALAIMLVKADPARFVHVMTKAKRDGKIYLDYLRNSRGASSITNYSVRARAGAPVAVPLSWEEFPARFKKGNYDIHSFARRIAQLKKDPWEEFYTSARELSPSMMKAVGL